MSHLWLVYSNVVEILELYSVCFQCMDTSSCCTIFPLKETTSLMSYMIPWIENQIQKAPRRKSFPIRTNPYPTPISKHIAFSKNNSVIFNVVSLLRKRHWKWQNSFPWYCLIQYLTLLRYNMINYPTINIFFFRLNQM